MKQHTPIILASWLAVWAQPSIAATVSEQDMKAALIYNFSVYTTWPQDTFKVFTICMFERDQETLNEAMLEKKAINGKQIHVKNIHDIEDVKSCQVLFMEEANQAQEKRLLPLLQKYSVLFIHNGQKHAEASMIKIELIDKRYAFSINLQAAKDANLTLSSKLLRLATRVY
jgi:hypothetical protein